jgi:glycosyltransferase involved in cell wall biosynthesis
MNEASSIADFLTGLLRQTRPPDEIVIVDGGSTDGTVAAIEQCRALSHVPIRLIEASGSNISEGRNIAISRAAHDVIAVTDAGTSPEPDWLEKLLAPLERDPDLAVSSGFFVPGGSGWRRRTLAIVITPQRQEIDPERFLPSSRSVAFRRAWWSRVGGYPEWLRHCEDLVFDLELRDAGASFAFVPDAIVAWDARPDLRSFARQYFNYARGDGHADLWPKRHLLRYGAYAAATCLLVRKRQRRSVVLLCLGWLGYQRKFLRRLLRMPSSTKRSEQLLAFAYTPVVVTVGDLAKMIGYALGRWERTSVRGSAAKSLASRDGKADG